MKTALAKSTHATFWVLILRLATLAITLLLLTRLLGPGIYGPYASISSMATLLGILPNNGAGYLMLASKGTPTHTTPSIWQYSWPLSILAGIILLAIYTPIARTLDTEAALTLSTIITIGIIELVVMPLVYLSSFALQANEQVPLGQLIQWLPLGIRTLAILPCFYFEDQHRLSALITGQFISATIGLFISLAITQKSLNLTWKPKKIKWPELKSGFTYSSMHFLAMNPSEIDKIMATRLVGAHEAGIYSATHRVMSAAITPITAMLLSAQPKLFQLSRGNPKEIRYLVSKVGTIAIIWGGISGIALAISSPILPWIFGETFRKMEDLMPYLAMAAPLTTLRVSSGTILVALGKPLQRVGLEALGTLAMLALMLTLTPLFQTKGLVFAFCISEAIMLAAGWFLIILKIHKDTT